MICRPAQEIFLRTFSDGLFEMHPDPSQPLRMVEEKPDYLLSGPFGPPARRVLGQQRMLNGVSGVLGGDLHLHEAF